MSNGMDLIVLQRLNQEYVRAVEERNTAWFEENLSQDFMNTGPDGTLTDRQDFLATIAKGTGVSSITESDVVIRITDVVAIIHAATAFVTDGGVHGRGRYTDIWLKRGHRWSCVAAHVSRY